MLWTLYLTFFFLFFFSYVLRMLMNGASRKRIIFFCGYHWCDFRKLDALDVNSITDFCSRKCMVEVDCFKKEKKSNEGISCQYFKYTWNYFRHIDLRIPGSIPGQQIHVSWNIYLLLIYLLFCLFVFICS